MFNLIYIRQNDTVLVRISTEESEEEAEEENHMEDKGVQLKEFLVVAFILGIWLYSIFR